MNELNVFKSKPSFTFFVIDFKAVATKAVTFP